jgi:hypothetical protein
VAIAAPAIVTMIAGAAVPLRCSDRQWTTPLLCSAASASVLVRIELVLPSHHHDQRLERVQHLDRFLLRRENRRQAWWWTTSLTPPPTRISRADTDDAS